MALKLGSLFVDIGADTSDLKRAEKEVARSTKNMGSQFSGLGRLIAAAFTIDAARRVVQLADTMALLDVRVKNATKDTKAYTKSMARLVAISNETGTAISGNVKLFEQLALAGEDLGATNDHVLKLTELFNKLGAVGGSSIEQMKNSQLQFSQAMAGGVLRAEEFNSILENTPFVARAIADGLGKSVGELRQMVIAGELMADDVFNSILSQSEEVEKAFATLPLTTARATEQMKNNFALVVKEINEGIDGSQDLALAIQGVAEYIKQIPNDIRVLFLGVYSELDQFVIKTMASLQVNLMLIEGFLTDFTEGQKETTRAVIKEINRERDARIAASEAALQAGLDAEAQLLAGKKGYGADAVAVKAEDLAPVESDKGGATLSKAEQARLEKIRLLGETELEEIERIASARREFVLGLDQLEADERAELLDKIQTEKLEKVKEHNEEVAATEEEAARKIASLRAAQQVAMLQGLTALGNNINAVLAETGNEGTAIAKAIFLAMKAIQVAQIIATTEVAAASAGAHGAIIGGLPGWLASSAGVRAMGYSSAALVAGLAVGQTVGGGRAMGGTVSPQMAHPINERGTPEILNQGGKQFLLPTGQGGTVTPMGSGNGGGGGTPNITIISNGTPQTIEGSSLSRDEITLMINDGNKATESRINASLATGRGDTARSLQTGFKSTRNLR